MFYILNRSFWARTFWGLSDGIDVYNVYSHYDYGRGVLAIEIDKYMPYDGKVAVKHDEKIYRQTTPAKALSIMGDVMPLRFWEFHEAPSAHDSNCDICKKPYWQCPHR